MTGFDLEPPCEECGTDQGIHKAIVGGTNPDGTHDVQEYHLECGHVTEPDARLGVTVVYMLSEVHPHTIEIDGELDEDILDEHLDSENDLGWRGYVWEALGMLMAVYIVAREKLGGLKRVVSR